MRLKKPHFTALQKMRGKRRTNLKKGRTDKFEKNWKSLANPVRAPGLIWEWLYKLPRTRNVLQNVLEMYQKM